MRVKIVVASLSGVLALVLAATASAAPNRYPPTPVRECGNLPGLSITNITTRNVPCGYARRVVPSLEIGNRRSLLGPNVIDWQCRSRYYHARLNTYTDRRCVSGARVVRWQTLWGE
jgi:hypothetical protein